MFGRIARIQVLWIDRNNPNKVWYYPIINDSNYDFKFFISLRMEANGQKYDIRGYRKNTQYNELCEKMIQMQPCEIPVKLHKEKYYFQ